MFVDPHYQSVVVGEKFRPFLITVKHCYFSVKGDSRNYLCGVNSIILEGNNTPVFEKSSFGFSEVIAVRNNYIGFEGKSDLYTEMKALAS